MVVAVRFSIHSPLMRALLITLLLFPLTLIGAEYHVYVDSSAVACGYE